jgi:transcriptional regulator with XRE-family HTH domain
MAQQPREATFGARLRDRRMECHLRQVELARLIGEPQNYISRWESGDIQYMTLERLRRLAKHLHTTTDYLLGLSNNPGKRIKSKPVAASQESELFPAAAALIGV